MKTITKKEAQNMIENSEDGEMMVESSVSCDDCGAKCRWEQMDNYIHYVPGEYSNENENMAGCKCPENHVKITNVTIEGIEIRA